MFCDLENEKISDSDLAPLSIFKLACEVFQTSLSKKTRKREVAVPRQVVIFVTMALTKASLNQFKGRYNLSDHTTLMHAHKTARSAIPSREKGAIYANCFSILCNALGVLEQDVFQIYDEKFPHTKIFIFSV